MTPAMVSAIKNSPKGKIPPGLAAYWAGKRSGKVPVNAPSPILPNPTTLTPTVAMTPPMVSAIRKSSKGQIPPGLAKWLATHKKTKK